MRTRRRTRWRCSKGKEWDTEMETRSGHKARTSAFMRNRINKFRASIQSTELSEPLRWWWIAISFGSYFCCCTFASFDFILELKFIFNRVLINYLSACNLIKSLLSTSGLASRVIRDGKRLRGCTRWGGVAGKSGNNDDMNNYCSAEDNLFKANEQWIIFAVINPPQFFPAKVTTEFQSSTLNIS